MNYCHKAYTTILFYGLIILSLSSLCFPEFGHASQSAAFSKVPKQSILTPTDAMTHFLIAELATIRDMPEVAIDNYIIVAEFSRDPAVAELATQYAIDARQMEEALTAATIWTQLAPRDIDARLVIITLLLENDPKSVTPHLASALDIESINFKSYLLLLYPKLTDAARTHLQAELITMATEQPNNTHLHLATAEIAAQQEDVQAAQQWTDSVLTLQPNLTDAIKLQARLIHYKADSENAALTYLKQESTKYPNDAQLKMFYATALLDHLRFKEATAQLEQLSTAKDSDIRGRALLKLGDIYLAENKLNRAENTLKKAIKMPDFNLKATFLLGQIFEQQNKIAKAIELYTNIQSGDYHLIAYLRAALLLTIEKQFDAAVALLKQARPETINEYKQLILTEIDILIEANKIQEAYILTSNELVTFPDDLDLLYTRGLIASNLKQFVQAEEDFLTILSITPEHANALNALGFLLSNQAGRQKEAMQYLNKALVLNPENPAFIDSLGWLHFKLGNIDKSIKLLTQAYQLNQDPEIAAHLGEVLWQAGQRKQATKILQQTLQAYPGNATLLEILNRLDIKTQQANGQPRRQIHQAQ